MVEKDKVRLSTNAVSPVRKMVRSKYDNVFKEKELRGSVASLGKVRGQVKKILSVSDMKNFKQGGILVSSMTRPDMTPALKKAAAIITDDGGITCHAAIISRELNIPCIVGTKIATRVLHDGDVVEVDANKGVVTVIKKI